VQAAAYRAGSALSSWSPMGDEGSAYRAGRPEGGGVERLQTVQARSVRQRARVGMCRVQERKGDRRCVRARSGVCARENRRCARVRLCKPDPNVATTPRALVWRG